MTAPAAPPLLLLLLHHCCCCNALPAEDCSEEFRWLGNLFQLHVMAALHNTQCWLRWEMVGMRDFKTRWETNSDHIDTPYFYKIASWISSWFLSWSPEFSHIHISFIFKLRRNFSSKDAFVEPLFSERQLGPLNLVTKASSNSFTFCEVIHTKP